MPRTARGGAGSPSSTSAEERPRGGVRDMLPQRRARERAASRATRKAAAAWEGDGDGERVVPAFGDGGGGERGNAATGDDGGVMRDTTGMHPAVGRRAAAKRDRRGSSGVAIYCGSIASGGAGGSCASAGVRASVGARGQREDCGSISCGGAGDFLASSGFDVGAGARPGGNGDVAGSVAHGGSRGGGADASATVVVKVGTGGHE